MLMVVWTCVVIYSIGLANKAVQAMKLLTCIKELRSLLSAGHHKVGYFVSSSSQILK